MTRSLRALVLADRNPRGGVLPLIAESPPDLVILLGDLDSFAISDLGEVELPKLGVYGNHCAGGYFELLGVENLHHRVVEVDGVRFGGLEGCPRYKEIGDYQYTEAEVDWMLRDFPHVDVFLTHTPPFGVNDEPGDRVHTGFHALREYVERERPAYLLHGHTGPTEIVTRFADTEIIYVFGHATVELFPGQERSSE